MSGTRGLVAALLTGAAALSALIACGDGSEGTVVAKAEQGVYPYACQAGGALTGPVAVPVWGTCSEPECWRLIVRDSGGATVQPCVSREEYDRTQLGTFWRERTDWGADQQRDPFPMNAPRLLRPEVQRPCSSTSGCAAPASSTRKER